MQSGNNAATVNGVQDKPAVKIEATKFKENTYRKRDSLTGLLNHASFHTELVQSFKFAKTRKIPIALLLIDIDFFHAVNHRYSYEFGDYILASVAKVIQRTIHSSAAIARFSGEQFSIVWFPESQDEAISKAEELRQKIANNQVVSKQFSTYVTVSAGLTVNDGHLKNSNELLSASQLVLKTAKSEGRNRICYWSPPEKKKHQELATENDILVELQQKFAEMEHEIKSFGTSEIRTILDDLSIPDGLSDEHAENVAFISASIADELGLSEHQIDTIISAALLHDIGKLGIDRNILSKPGPLTEDEFEEIKKHPLLGVEFLNESQFLDKELPLILHHHERFDGKGYPNGLKGEAIPVGARIIGIAETIDGLLSGSTYREALSLRATLTELRRCAGTQFDPKIVEIAIKLLETGRIG
ncbi:MAG: diguanylate cyclase [Calditrichaeota bacterium]|nr:MAG: diguanylate cyclase [Calditrichota bacterium]